MQLEQWHQAVSAWFDEAIAQQLKEVQDGRLQSYNPATLDPGGLSWSKISRGMLSRRSFYGSTDANALFEKQTRSGLLRDTALVTRVPS